MAETLKQEFEIVRNHVILLHTEWQFYEQLYLKADSLHIINNSASFFFNRLQIILVDSVILKMAKLLEKKQTRTNKNLSIDYLVAEVHQNHLDKVHQLRYVVGYRDGKFLTSLFTLMRNTHIGGFLKINYWFNEVPTLDVRIKDLRRIFKELNDYRNKNVAHIDYQTNTQKINHIPENILEILHLAIKNITILMNEIEVLLNNCSTCYEAIIYNGVDTLFVDILRGKRYKELLTDGIIEPNDFIKNIDKLKGKEV